jgi:ribonuclease BN (tRNA processing enzyme)
VELIVLGWGGGWPLAGGAACGYLVRHDGFNLWVDAGTGTMANLQRHIGPRDVGAIAISHRHFDHFLDLYPYYLSRWLRWDEPAKPKLPLFAPPGLFEHALKLEDALAVAFDPRAVEAGGDFEIGPFRVRTAPMRHPVPTLGMRIEANGSSLAYSADTGPTDDLVRLAKDADVLLCEATFLDPGEGSPDFHLASSEAGEHAARAGAGRLILTHIWPTNDRAAALERATKAFDGPVTLAEDGLKVSL